MAAYSRDDDYLQMIALIMLLLLVIIAILQFCGATAPGACPAGSYACTSSPCGCCRQNSDGSIDICSACADYISVGGKCCSKANPQQCIFLTAQCIYPPSCTSDAECSMNPCPASKCEADASGLLKCKPCTTGAVCNADDPNSCCSGMVCSNGRCEPQDKCIFGCKNDTECSSVPGCANFGCNTLTKLCENCAAKPCTTRADCCSGARWDCVNGVCTDCFTACDPLNPKCACAGMKCENGRCTGCKEGAACDASNPCCSGFKCNLQTGKCEPCNKQCTTNEECCTGGLCIRGVCSYSNSCKDLPCPNPGEACIICSGSNNCISCTDNTVCGLNKNTGSFQCVNPAEMCEQGFTYNPISGECECDEGGHKCVNVEGCSCCSSGDVTVTACPDGMLMCQNYGCIAPSVTCEIVGGRPECSFPRTGCPKGTFECTKKEGACCTYFVPANGIPSGIKAVDTTTCLSGYGFDAVLGGQLRGMNVTLLTCCDLVTYTKSAGTFTYTFVCGGKTYTGKSTVSPYESVVMTAMQFDDSFCKKKADECTAKGIPLSVCFTQPIIIRIGGK